MSKIDESRLRELQSALNVKVAANKELADSFKYEDGIMHVNAEQKAAFDANMRDIKEIKGLIDGLKSLEEIDAWGREPEGDSAAAAAYAGAQFQAPSAKTLGEMFIDSPEFKSLNGGRNGANMPAPFTLQKGDVSSMWMNRKDVYTALPSGTPGSFGRVDRDPMVIPPMRTRRVRDLFPSRTTTAAVIEYFKLTGFTNAAAAVAERRTPDADPIAFGLKPQSGMAFTGAQAPIRTLAHWEAAHRNVLADEPQLRSIIDNELLYGLRLQEDFQILQGDGNGENLTGLLNTNGIQNYSWSSGAVSPVPDTKADALRRAATLSFLAYYEPTGIVMHPNDWEDIELTKDANGQYLVAVSVALGGEPRLWRLPVVDTPAIPEGTALVGAFGTAAQIYDREQATVRISEQHADFFVRNAIVILVEERLGLACKRPESLVKVSFDAAPQ